MEPPEVINASIDSDHEDLTREWLKIDRNINNDGFLTGVERGHEQSLQAGFNSGFREALHMALAAGKFQGSLSASLTYLPSTVHTPTPAHSSSPGQTEIASLAESTDMFSISLHHQLLSSNAGLISSIPSLLQNSPHFTQHECLGSSSDSCCVKKDPVFEYLEIFPPLKEPFGCLATSQRKVRDEKRLEGEDPGQACDLICSNRSQFWNQLEHFKIQAQSLEFISSHD